MQGGPFDAEGAASFLAMPHAEAAVRVRRYDEAAKERSRKTAGLEEFRAWIERAAAHA